MSVVFSLVGQRFEVSLQRTYAGSSDFKVPMLVQRDPHTGITSTSNEEVPGWTVTAACESFRRRHGID